MECKYEAASQNLLKIGEIPATLISWIPKVSEETQKCIAATLFDIFNASTANRVVATEAGICSVIIDILQEVKLDDTGKVSEEIVHLLIGTLSSLCSFSLTPTDLTAILRLMTTYRELGPLLLSCLSQMPRFPAVAQHFFELYDFGAGMTSDELSPSSYGLTFFAWICLDPLPTKVKTRRRCILSLLDRDFRGFELFLSENNFLVAAHYTKQSCLTVESRKPIVDSNWHSVAVVWSFGTLLGQPGSCQIVIDGQLEKEARMQIASVDKVKMRIGCGIDMPSAGSTLSSSSSFGSFGQLVGSLTSRMTRSQSNSQLTLDAAVTLTKAAERDETFGRPGTMYGLMGYNAVLDNVVGLRTLSLLHSWGPNSLLQFQSTNSATSDLQLYLQCYYHPKNTDGHLVRNLAPNGRHDACLTGRTHGAIDIRGAVHALSGICVLFPIL